MLNESVINKRTNDLVTLLARGICQRRMYFAEHPKIQHCGVDTVKLLKSHLADANQEAFFLGVAEGKLIFEGKFLVGPTIVGSRLVEFADALKCGGFLFKNSVGAVDIMNLFALAAQMPTPPNTLEEAKQLFKSQNINSIDLSPVYEDVGWLGQFVYDGQDNNGLSTTGDVDLINMLPMYQSLFESVQDNQDNAGLERTVDVNRTQSAVEELLKASRGNVTDIMQVVRYPDYDSYTVGHSVRVAMLAVIVGRHIGMEEDNLAELAVAGLLHDVGKAQISTEILFKNGQLDPEERALMEKHPEIGANLLLENGDCSQMAVAVAFGHHLRFDGGGYPKASSMPRGGMATQLVHLCDVFEAITAVRPYKKAMTPRKAYEIILADRVAYVPEILAAFVDAIGLYPPGNRVRLSDGRLATVVRASQQFDRPKIQVTHQACGAALSEADKVELDLSMVGEKVAIEEMLLVV